MLIAAGILKKEGKIVHCDESVANLGNKRKEKKRIIAEKLIVILFSHKVFFIKFLNSNNKYKIHSNSLGTHKRKHLKDERD